MATINPLQPASPLYPTNTDIIEANFDELNTKKIEEAPINWSNYVRKDWAWNVLSAWSWDVVWPASATDWVPVLFDWITGKLIKNSAPTGTGNPVMQTSPTLVTPVLWVASATSVTTSGSIELWHVSDTSLSRVSAGKIAVEWVNVWTENILQNSKSTAYTLVLADAWKHIYHPSADTTARIWTIPANASVAYPIGTAITFINDTSAGVITIAITTDTLVLAWPWTTWSRTLASNWVCTAIKITTTRWQISWNWLT